MNVLSRPGHLSVEGLSRGNWTGFAILMTFLLSLRRLPQFYKKKSRVSHVFNHQEEVGGGPTKGRPIG